jgi:hypothetical protein
MTKRLRTKTVATITDENATKKTKVNGRDQKGYHEKMVERTLHHIDIAP